MWKKRKLKQKPVYSIFSHFFEYLAECGEDFMTEWTNKRNYHRGKIALDFFANHEDTEGLVKELYDDWRSLGVSGRYMKDRIKEFGHVKEGDYTPITFVIHYICDYSGEWKLQQIDNSKGFVKTTNPFQRLAGNCFQTNRAVFKDFLDKGRKAELWEIYQNGFYHVVVYLNNKIIDKSNGQEKIMVWEYYNETFDIRITHKYKIYKW